jgi:hypothetical protein
MKLMLLASFLATTGTLLQTYRYNFDYINNLIADISGKVKENTKTDRERKAEITNNETFDLKREELEEKITDLKDDFNKYITYLAKTRRGQEVEEVSLNEISASKEDLLTLKNELLSSLFNTYNQLRTNIKILDDYDNVEKLKELAENQGSDACKIVRNGKGKLFDADTRIRTTPSDDITYFSKSFNLNELEFENIVESNGIAFNIPEVLKADKCEVDMDRDQLRDETKVYIDKLEEINTLKVSINELFKATENYNNIINTLAEKQLEKPIDILRLLRKQDFLESTTFSDIATNEIYEEYIVNSILLAETHLKYNWAKNSPYFDPKQEYKNKDFLPEDSPYEKSGHERLSYIRVKYKDRDSRCDVTTGFQTFKEQAPIFLATFTQQNAKNLFIDKSPYDCFEALDDVRCRAFAKGHGTRDFGEFSGLIKKEYSIYKKELTKKQLSVLIINNKLKNIVFSVLSFKMNYKFIYLTRGKKKANEYLDDWRKAYQKRSMSPMGDILDMSKMETALDNLATKLIENISRYATPTRKCYTHMDNPFDSKETAVAIQSAFELLEFRDYPLKAELVDYEPEEFDLDY